MQVYKPDNLLLTGEYQTEEGFAAANQTLVLGQVVKKNAEGDFEAVTALTVADAYGIIADPVVTSSTKAPTVVYVHGAFPKKRIVIPGETKVEDFITPLRNKGIYLKHTESDGVVNV